MTHDSVSVLRYPLLALATLAFVSGSLVAQEQDLGLAVRKGQLQKNGYSFELVNTSSKAIVGWTMAVALNNNLRFFEPDSCSLPPHPLPTGGTLPCTLPVVEPTEVRITSVLFDDETAAGDLELLDATIENHWSTYRELLYWEKRAQAVRSEPDLLSALRTLQRETHEELPLLSDHDAYSHAAVMARREVRSMAGTGVQQITEHLFPAQQVFDSVLRAIQLREQVEGVLAATFPRPKQRLSPAAVFHPSTRELRNPTPLTVLLFEENNHSLRVVIRNDTNRAVSSWGFRATGENTRLSSRVSHGLGNALIQPGWVEVLELESKPAPAYRIVSLEATFAEAPVSAAVPQ